MDLALVKQLAESHYLSHDHPLLVIDLGVLRSNYRSFKKNLPDVDVHFALKCMTDKEAVLSLAREGCSFEVASLGELQLLGKLLPQSQLKRVFYSNPVKSKRSLTAALLAGIRWFSVDSLEEIVKIKRVADSLDVSSEELHLYLRVQALSRNSIWPLSSKFGASTDKVHEIINELITLKIKLSGFTFHVGSQCLDVEAWGNSLLYVDQLIGYCTSLNVITDEVIVNLGGGFPSSVTFHRSTLDLISTHLHESLAKCLHRSRISLAAEPGRSLASSAGVLSTRVLLRTSKKGENWLYLDCGTYHGMIEPTQGVMGRASTTFESDVHCEYVLAGPSCDSADVIPVSVFLPAAMHEDDLIFIENSGAYTMAYATGSSESYKPGFNGFLSPSVYYLHK